MLTVAPLAVPWLLCFSGHALQLGSSAFPARGSALSHWAPRHCLGCSSQLPAKPPIPPRLTLQASYEEERIASANLDKAEFITEAMELTVLYYKGRPIDVQVRRRV